MDQQTEHEGLVGLTADIVAAYVTRNGVDPKEIPMLIKSVHDTLRGLDEAPVVLEPQRPAVSVGRSVQPDYIVCLEDGKRLKMLKRYLRARFGMSPDEYRRKWNLPPDYPMVAPNYAQRRSEFAKEIGLGRGVRKRPRTVRS